MNTQPSAAPVPKDEGAPCVALNDDNSRNAVTRPVEQYESSETIRNKCLDIVRSKTSDNVAKGSAIARLNSPALLIPYGSFEQLVKRELKLSRAHAHRLIQYEKLVARLREALGPDVSLPSLSEGAYLNANWPDILHPTVWIMCLQSKRDGSQSASLRKMREDTDWPQREKCRRALQWPPKSILRHIDRIISWSGEQPAFESERQLIAQFREKLISNANPHADGK